MAGTSSQPTSPRRQPYSPSRSNRGSPSRRTNSREDGRRRRMAQRAVQIGTDASGKPIMQAVALPQSQAQGLPAQSTSNTSQEIPSSIAFSPSSSSDDGGSQEHGPQPVSRSPRPRRHPRLRPQKRTTSRLPNPMGVKKRQRGLIRPRDNPATLEEATNELRVVIAHNFTVRATPGSTTVAATAADSTERPPVTLDELALANEHDGDGTTRQTTASVTLRTDRRMSVQPITIRYSPLTANWGNVTRCFSAKSLMSHSTQ